MCKINQTLFTTKLASYPIPLFKFYGCFQLGFVKWKIYNSSIRNFWTMTRKIICLDKSMPEELRADGFQMHLSRKYFHILFGHLNLALLNTAIWLASE
jgi:hypothetical protein